jgi:choline dehydrogenase-like flavoprotein
MPTNRGDAEDYDSWGALGNANYSWKNMLPYFKKVGASWQFISPASPTLTCGCYSQSENFTAPSAALAAAGNITWDDSVRGHSGPVQYSYANYFYPGSGK